jgi:hypothetical protein
MLVHCTNSRCYRKYLEEFGVNFITTVVALFICQQQKEIYTYVYDSSVGIETGYGLDGPSTISDIVIFFSPP